MGGCLGGGRPLRYFLVSRVVFLGCFTDVVCVEDAMAGLGDGSGERRYERFVEGPGVVGSRIDR